MSSRTCPDWPELMEVAPELQFKHYTVAEAHMPAEIVSRLPPQVSLDTLALCCDLDHHVFNPHHTEPEVAEALRSSHWFDVAEWSRGPGATAA